MHIADGGLFDSAYMDTTNFAEDDDIKSVLQERGLLDAFQGVGARYLCKSVGRTWNDINAFGLGSQTHLDAHNNRIFSLGLMRHNDTLVNYLRAALFPSDASRKNSAHLDTIRGSLYSAEVKRSLFSMIHSPKIGCSVLGGSKLCEPGRLCIV